MSDRARDVAAAVTRSAADDLIRAARSVPSERALWRAGGVANHTVGIVAHCAVGTRFFAAIFAGAAIPYRTQSEREAAMARLETLPLAEKALLDAVSDLDDAIARIPDSQLAELMVMPWGERMPYARGILMPALHLQYHAGQINYLQCLMGDDEHH